MQWLNDFTSRLLGYIWLDDGNELQSFYYELDVYEHGRTLLNLILQNNKMF